MTTLKQFVVNFKLATVSLVGVNWIELGKTPLSKDLTILLLPVLTNNEYKEKFILRLSSFYIWINSEELIKSFFDFLRNFLLACHAMKWLKSYWQ